MSAIFGDKNYEKKFGIPHRGIDIPIPQNSKIVAPDLAVVLKKVEKTNGYSYLILAHKNNFTTTFGHLLKIAVDEGQTIQKGELIGFSGGVPGTPGAGVITTGAHLHFEIAQNGEPKNPLDFLPKNSETNSK